jgi:hypothetical protein
VLHRVDLCQHRRIAPGKARQVVVGEHAIAVAVGLGEARGPGGLEFGQADLAVMVGIGLGKALGGIRSAHLGMGAGGRNGQRAEDESTGKVSHDSGSCSVRSQRPQAITLPTASVQLPLCESPSPLV